MHGFRLGRPSPALAVALIALFVALGGTGYAASQLSQPGASVAKKKKSSHPDAAQDLKLIKKQAAKLKGPKGLKGDPGTAGAAGANGATKVVARRGASSAIPATGTILTVSCQGSERAVGGGLLGDSTAVTTIDSTPMTGMGAPSQTGETPTGWWVDAKTSDGATHNGQAMVVCASP